MAGCVAVFQTGCQWSECISQMIMTVIRKNYAMTNGNLGLYTQSHLACCMKYKALWRMAVPRNITVVLTEQTTPVPYQSWL